MGLNKSIKDYKNLQIQLEENRYEKEMDFTSYSTPYAHFCCDCGNLTDTDKWATYYDIPWCECFCEDSYGIIRVLPGLHVIPHHRQQQHGL